MASSLHQHKGKPWGGVSTPVPGNHLSATFQGEGSVDSGSAAFRSQRGAPWVSDQEIGGTPACLQQSAWLSANGLQPLLAWGSSDDWHLDSGRLILLIKPSNLGGRPGQVTGCKATPVWAAQPASMMSEEDKLSELSCEGQAQRTDYAICLWRAMWAMSSHGMFQNREKGKKDVSKITGGTRLPWAVTSSKAGG